MLTRMSTFGLLFFCLVTQLFATDQRKVSSEKKSDKTIIEKNPTLTTHKEPTITTFADSIYTLHADLNKLTGQPQFSINLGPYATLQYKGGVAGDISRPNEQSPVGLIGLGWKFGTPYITVDHKYTVDIGDDRWYWNDGYGNGDEIIRVLEDVDGTMQERFYLQNSPERSVRVLATGTGHQKIIRGWEIYEIDGTISRYGYVDGESDDARRTILSWENYIGKGVVNATVAPTPFSYQWDLKVVEDVNGQKTRFFFYEPDPRLTGTNYEYTGESAIRFIRTPVGDTIKFTYGSIDETSNEGQTSAGID